MKRRPPGFPRRLAPFIAGETGTPASRGRVSYHSGLRVLGGLGEPLGTATRRALGLGELGPVQHLLWMDLVHEELFGKLGRVVDFNLMDTKHKVDFTTAVDTFLKIEYVNIECREYGKNISSEPSEKRNM